MEKEEFLATHTSSELGLPTWRRVYETLTQNGAETAKCNAKLLAWLVHQLEDNGALTSQQIDDMLIEVI